MIKYNNIEEEIDAFLNHSMSQEEEQQFKTRINNSPELAEEVRLQKIVVESLRLLHREQTIERLRKNTTVHDFEQSSKSPAGFQRFKYWIWGLLGLIACFGAYWWIFRAPSVHPLTASRDVNAIQPTQDSVNERVAKIFGKRKDTLNQNSLDLDIKFPERGQYKIKLKIPPNNNKIKIGTSPPAADIVRIAQKIDPGFKKECLEPRAHNMDASSSASTTADVFENSRKLILAGTTQSLNEALDTLNNMNKAMLEGENPQEFYLLRGYTYFNLQQLDEAYADFDRPELYQSGTRKLTADFYKWLCLRAYYDQYQSKADDLERILRKHKRYQTKIDQYLGELNERK